MAGGGPTASEGFVRSYDTDGNELSTTTVDASGAVKPWGVATSPAGIFLGGGVEGRFPGQWMHGPLEDAFVARLG